MNPTLFRSIATLTLASILLAIGTLLLSIMLGPRPNWPEVMQRPEAVPDEIAPPTGTSPTVQQTPIDRNLRELHRALHDQEQSIGKAIQFPLGVEEAMIGQVFAARASIAFLLKSTDCPLASNRPIADR